jgi:hypothetical protein
MIPVTEVEIKSIINSLKAEDSSGYDEISSEVLKLCRHRLGIFCPTFAINQYLWVFSGMSQMCYCEALV